MSKRFRNVDPEQILTARLSKMESDIAALKSNANWGLVERRYASISIIAGAGTNQVMTGADEKITPWTGNGNYANMLPDYLNDKITVTMPGTYEVSVVGSLTSSVGNNLWWHIKLDGVIQQGLRAIQFSPAAESVIFSIRGHIRIETVPAVLELWCDPTVATTLTFRYVNLLVRNL